MSQQCKTKRIKKSLSHSLLEELSLSLENQNRKHELTPKKKRKHAHKRKTSLGTEVKQRGFKKRNNHRRSRQSPLEKISFTPKHRHSLTPRKKIRRGLSFSKNKHGRKFSMSPSVSSAKLNRRKIPSSFPRRRSLGNLLGHGRRFSSDDFAELQIPQHIEERKHLNSKLTSEAPPTILESLSIIEEKVEGVFKFRRKNSTFLFWKKAISRLKFFWNQESEFQWKNLDNVMCQDAIKKFGYALNFAVNIWSTEKPDLLNGHQENIFLIAEARLLVTFSRIVDAKENRTVDRAFDIKPWESNQEQDFLMTDFGFHTDAGDDSDDDAYEDREGVPTLVRGLSSGARITGRRKNHHDQVINKPQKRCRVQDILFWPRFFYEYKDEEIPLKIFQYALWLHLHLVEDQKQNNICVKKEVFFKMVRHTFGFEEFEDDGEIYISRNVGGTRTGKGIWSAWIKKFGPRLCDVFEHMKGITLPDGHLVEWMDLSSTSNDAEKKILNTSVADDLLDESKPIYLIQSETADHFLLHYMKKSERHHGCMEKTYVKLHIPEGDTKYEFGKKSEKMKFDNIRQAINSKKNHIRDIHGDLDELDSENDEWKTLDDKMKKMFKKRSWTYEQKFENEYQLGIFFGYDVFQSFGCCQTLDQFKWSLSIVWDSKIEFMKNKKIVPKSKYDWRYLNQILLRAWEKFPWWGFLEHYERSFGGDSTDNVIKEVINKIIEFLITQIKELQKNEDIEKIKSMVDNFRQFLGLSEFKLLWFSLFDLDHEYNTARLALQLAQCLSRLFNLLNMKQTPWSTLYLKIASFSIQCQYMKKSNVWFSLIQDVLAFFGEFSHGHTVNICSAAEDYVSLMQPLRYFKKHSIMYWKKNSAHNPFNEPLDEYLQKIEIEHWIEREDTLRTLYLIAYGLRLRVDFLSVVSSEDDNVERVSLLDNPSDEIAEQSDSNSDEEDNEKEDSVKPSKYQTDSRIIQRGIAILLDEGFIHDAALACLSIWKNLNNIVSNVPRDVNPGLEIEKFICERIAKYPHNYYLRSEECRWVDTYQDEDFNLQPVKKEDIPMTPSRFKKKKIWKKIEDKRKATQGINFLVGFTKEVALLLRLVLYSRYRSVLLTRQREWLVKYLQEMCHLPCFNCDYENKGGVLLKKRVSTLGENLKKAFNNHFLVADIVAMSSFPVPSHLQITLENLRSKVDNLRKEFKTRIMGLEVVNIDGEIIIYHFELKHNLSLLDSNSNLCEMQKKLIFEVPPDSRSFVRQTFVIRALIDLAQMFVHQKMISNWNRLIRFIADNDVLWSRLSSFILLPMSAVILMTSNKTESGQIERGVPGAFEIISWLYILTTALTLAAYFLDHIVYDYFRLSEHRKRSSDSLMIMVQVFFTWGLFGKLLHILVAIVGHSTHPFYCINVLITVAEMDSTKHVLEVLTTHIVSLGTALLAAVCILYAFATISFFSPMHGQYSFGSGPIAWNTFMSTFMGHVDAGLHSEPVWGCPRDFPPNDPWTQSRSYCNISTEWRLNDPDPQSLVGFMFNFFYNILIFLFTMSIISGLIIDAFGEIREKRNTQVSAEFEKCFVCGISREDVNINVNFDYHITTRHSRHTYLNLIINILTDKTQHEMFSFRQRALESSLKQRVSIGCGSVLPSFAIHGSILASPLLQMPIEKEFKLVSEEWSEKSLWNIPYLPQTASGNKKYQKQNMSTEERISKLEENIMELKAIFEEQTKNELQWEQEEKLWKEEIQQRLHSLAHSLGSQPKKSNITPKDPHKFI